MTNPTAYEIAMLSATIAHGRDPLLHITDAWDLLRACQAPTNPPVESSRRLDLELALEVALPDSNPSRRRDKLRKFLQAEAAQMRLKCGGKPDPIGDRRNAQALFEEYERDGIPSGWIEKLAGWK